MTTAKQFRCSDAEQELYPISSPPCHPLRFALCVSHAKYHGNSQELGTKALFADSTAVIRPWLQEDKGSPSSPLPVHSTLCWARASPGGHAPLPAQSVLTEARPSFVTIPAFVNTNANPSLWITIFCLLKNSLHVILSVRGSREGAGQGSPGSVAELT